MSEKAEKPKSVDSATLKMLEKAHKDGIETVYDRADKMKPCPIGADGNCCKHCAMGPCRVTPKKDGTQPVGLCGATAETISARNFARMIAPCMTSGLETRLLGSRLSYGFRRRD